jgi:hypothetical protein
MRIGLVLAYCEDGAIWDCDGLSVWYERISKEEDATKVWPELLG